MFLFDIDMFCYILMSSPLQGASLYLQINFFFRNHSPFKVILVLSIVYSFLIWKTNRVGVD